MSTSSQDHHFVHRSYLSGWASGDGKVEIFYKDPAGRFRVSPRRVFYGPDAMTIDWDDGEPDDTLESEWSRIESKAAPGLRRVRTTGELTSSDDIEALAATATLLWARGEQVRAACADIAGQTITSRSLEILGRLEDYEDLFEEELGRPPEDGEVEQIAFDRFQEMVDSRFLTVTSMVHNFNKFGEYLSGMYIELITAPGPMGFSTSDSPLVILDQDAGRIGVTAGLALDDSSLIFLPLSRTVACSFVSAPRQPLTITNHSVEMVNKKLNWPHAQTAVVAHPSEHPSGVVPDFPEWCARLDPSWRPGWP